MWRPWGQYACGFVEVELPGHDGGQVRARVDQLIALCRLPCLIGLSRCFGSDCMAPEYNGT